jgi:hypothetical protein
MVEGHSSDYRGGPSDRGTRRRRSVSPTCCQGGRGRVRCAPYFPQQNFRTKIGTRSEMWEFCPLRFAGGVELVP